MSIEVEKLPEEVGNSFVQNPDSGENSKEFFTFTGQEINALQQVTIEIQEESIRTLLQGAEQISYIPEEEIIIDGTKISLKGNGSLGIQALAYALQLAVDSATDRTSVELDVTSTLLLPQPEEVGLDEEELQAAEEAFQHIQTHDFHSVVEVTKFFRSVCKAKPHLVVYTPEGFEILISSRDLSNFFAVLKTFLQSSFQERDLISAQEFHSADQKRFSVGVFSFVRGTRRKDYYSQDAKSGVLVIETLSTEEFQQKKSETVSQAEGLTSDERIADYLEKSLRKTFMFRLSSFLKEKTSFEEKRNRVDSVQKQILDEIVHAHSKLSAQPHFIVQVLTTRWGIPKEHFERNAAPSSYALLAAIESAYPKILQKIASDLMLELLEIDIQALLITRSEEELFKLAELSGIKIRFEGFEALNIGFELMRNAVGWPLDLEQHIPPINLKIYELVEEYIGLTRADMNREKVQKSLVQMIKLESFVDHLLSKCDGEIKADEARKSLDSLFSRLKVLNVEALGIENQSALQFFKELTPQKAQQCIDTLQGFMNQDLVESLFDLENVQNVATLSRCIELQNTTDTIEHLADYETTAEGKVAINEFVIEVATCQNLDSDTRYCSAARNTVIQGMRKYQAEKRKPAEEFCRGAINLIAHSFAAAAPEQAVITKDGLRYIKRACVAFRSLFLYSSNSIQAYCEIAGKPLSLEMKTEVTDRQKLLFDLVTCNESLLRERIRLLNIETKLS